LWQPQCSWPEQASFIESDLPDPEIKNQATNLACFAVLSDTSNCLDKLISRFSSWHKLLRTVVWVLRFKNIFLSKINKSDSRTEVKCHISNPLTTAELWEAEKLLLAHQQQIFYGDEMSNLSLDKRIKRSSSISKLNPFLQEGLIRVGGCLKFALVPYAQKHPIILHPSSPLTELIVFDAHMKLGHAGREHVLSYLRQKIWVTKGSSTVRRILQTCVTCR